MTLFLTGSPTRFGEDHFTEDNGFLAEVKAALDEATGGRRRPRVLLVSAAPDDRGFTDSVKKGMSDCIHNSGIATASITMLDRRNAGRAAALVKRADWVVMCGGHAPTQNRFIHEIGLRELLKDFPGVILGCSAGSMNCAEWVYSHPEFNGRNRNFRIKARVTGEGGEVVDAAVQTHALDVVVVLEVVGVTEGKVVDLPVVTVLDVVADDALGVADPFLCISD